MVKSKNVLGINPILTRIKQLKPVVHHLTNWVTIYDCANVVKVLGASPVMAHAPQEVEQMAGIASALVLNIGTLTVDLVEAMKKAAAVANKRMIPVVLDCCGSGATQLRDRMCLELLKDVHIDVLKGNASEIARLVGANTRTKGVDTAEIKADLMKIARRASFKYKCTVVITGKEDFIASNNKVYIVRNGHHLMANVVGTGCMAASVIGTFCAVEKDLGWACAAGLSFFEIAAELAAKRSAGPGTFKQQLYDQLYVLDAKMFEKMQKIEYHENKSFICKS